MTEKIYTKSLADAAERTVIQILFKYFELALYRLKIA